MNAARHEAGHAAALYLLDLAGVLRPGGAAIRQAGGGALILDRPDYTAADCMRSADAAGEIPPCRLAIDTARERPELAPAIMLFFLAGYGATPDRWRGDFWESVAVRTSSDFATAREIIIDLAGDDCEAVQCFASQTVYDALGRAVEWAALPHVRTMIDAAAAYLEAHGAASWLGLETIFSATAETSRGGTLTASVCTPDENPLAGAESGTMAGEAPPAAVGSQAPHDTTTETKGKV